MKIFHVSLLVYSKLYKLHSFLASIVLPRCYHYYDNFLLHPKKYSFTVLCVCVCVVIPFILDARFVDAPAGVTQEEGYTGFLHLPSAVLTLIFLARRIQLFLFHVDMKSNFVY